MIASTPGEPVDVGGAGYDLVHVVTVTHNSASTLDRYFAALQSSQHRIAGVTIVDNASTDSTVARVRSEALSSSIRIELFENENEGFAGGYARAARSAVRRGIPALALNPDVALTPVAIDAMLDVMNSFSHAAVVTTPLVDLNNEPDTASRRRLPTLSGSVLYSILGARTPAALRYNSRRESEGRHVSSAGGVPVSILEATTGALMLVAPSFRTVDEGLFDTDYWMYGEDLQLCADARRAGRTVLMAETAPSVHVKGVSSGRPRSRRSNRAFHTAMTIYARKNLVNHPVAILALRTGIEAHFVVSEARARRSRRRTNPGVRPEAPERTT